MTSTSYEIRYDLQLIVTTRNMSDPPCRGPDKHVEFLYHVLLPMTNIHVKVSILP